MRTTLKRKMEMKGTHEDDEHVSVFNVIGSNETVRHWRKLHKSVEQLDQKQKIMKIIIIIIILSKKIL